MKQLIFIALFMMSALKVFSSGHNNCLLYPVSLEERVLQSDFIVEGRIVASNTLFDSIRRMIYTRYAIEIQGTIKGDEADTVIMQCEGGRYGNTMLIVTPSLHPEHGSYGIFFLKKILHEQNTIITIPFAGPQSMILAHDGKASEPFKEYTSLLDALERIIAITQKPYRIQSPFHQELNKKFEKNLAASISSISPTTSTAGTNSVLTISGSGFGASRTGNAKVEFKNANDGGSTWVTALASHFVSWSDAQIQVRIPSGAGTGQVRVTGVDGSQSVSGQQITIQYALITNTFSNTQYRIWLNNQNLNGGHTFTFNNAFGTSPTDAFKRALQTWRCNTFVNIGVSGTTTSTNQYSLDNVNVVSFNASLPTGALGVTYNWYNNCANDQWYNLEFDMIFAPSPGAGWNFGPEATTGGKYDFETVVLHELGHAHQLGHVINASYVMHYSLGTNTDKRTLNAQSDIAGGNDVVTFSTSNKPCGPSSMQALNAGNCGLFAPPVAQFSATPLSGCAPLQVQFTDQSLNTPTSWSWDIDNNGTTDYTTKNPVHTYTNGGTYSVKLTVSSGSGNSSATMTSYITVNPQPYAQGKGIVNPCYGNTITLGPANAPTGGMPPYTYSWTPTLDLSNPFIQNPQLSVNFSAPRIYALTISDQRGCSIVVYDTIMPNPQLIVGAGADKYECFGTQVVLGGQPTIVGGTPPYTYSWFPSNGLSSSNVANPVLNITTNQMYICTVIDSRNCIKRDTVNVYVNPQTIANAGIDKIVCMNETVILGGQPTAQGGTPPYQYQWTPASGLLNPTSANPKVLVPQTMKYAVTITDALGCIAYDTVQITAKLVSTPQLRIARGSTTLCKGDTLELEVLGDFTSYVWSNGKTTRSIIINDSGTYGVTAYASNGCSAHSDSMHVNVIAKPSMIISGATTVCAEEMSTYSVAKEDGIQNSWQVQGGTILGKNTADSVVIAWNNVDGILGIQRNNQQCMFSEFILIHVRTIEKPVLQTLQSNQACEGDTIELGITKPFYAYSWSDGSSKQYNRITKTGLYFVRVIDSNSCSAISDSLNITFHALPSIPDIQLIDDSLISSPAMSYQWYNAQGIIPGAINRSYRPFTTNDYRVRIWDIHGCSSISQPYSFVALPNAIEKEYSSGIRVLSYPNPLSIQILHSHKEGETIQLINLLGIVVYKASLQTNLHTIDTELIPTGYYLLMIGRESIPLIVGSR